MTEQNGQDPSMEDILSSIRRILSEDEEGGGEEKAAEATPEPEPEPQPQPEPEPEPQPEPQPQPEPEPQPAPQPAPQPQPKEEDVLELTEAMKVADDHEPPEVPEGESLLSGQAVNATACQFADLARKVAQDRNFAIGSGNLTLEELVRQAVRPFIKEWLDANLPYLVERIVKQEIERVVERADRL